MRRRALLAAVGAGAAVALAGCTEIGEESVDLSGNELVNCRNRELGGGTYVPDADTDQGVSLGANNLTSEAWTATVQVSRDGETIVDETVSPAPAEFVGISDGGITETGDYQLSVDVDGGDTTTVTWRVCVETFVLVVLIDEDGAVRFRKRENEYGE